MKPMRARVNFLREPGGAAADNHTSCFAFAHSLTASNVHS
jgi:hypothetical protein